MRIILLPATYLLISLAVIIHKEIAYTDTKGANDNASGVAALLGALERIGRESLQETEVGWHNWKNRAPH